MINSNRRFNGMPVPRQWANQILGFHGGHIPPPSSEWKCVSCRKVHFLGVDFVHCSSFRHRTLCYIHGNFNRGLWKLSSICILHLHVLYFKELFFLYYYCHVLGACVYETIDEVWTGDWIYWHTCHTTWTASNYSAVTDLHNSQVTTASAKPFSSLLSSTAVPQQRLLTVEILQLPALTSLLSSEYPITELLSTVNSTTAPSLLSIPCRDANPQLDSLTHQPTTSLHSTELHSVGLRS
jgi:hypothetical protein